MSTFQMNRFSRDFLLNFKREPSTVWCTCIIKSPDFNVLVSIMIFPTKAFIQWILCICSFSGKSILNLKSTRTPEQIEQLLFGAIGAKISLYKPYEQKSIPILYS